MKHQSRLERILGHFDKEIAALHQEKARAALALVEERAVTPSDVSKKIIPIFLKAGWIRHAAYAASLSGLKKRAARLYETAIVQAETSGDMHQAFEIALEAGLEKKAKELYATVQEGIILRDGYEKAVVIAHRLHLPDKVIDHLEASGDIESAAKIALKEGMTDRATELYGRFVAGKFARYTDIDLKEIDARLPQGWKDRALELLAQRGHFYLAINFARKTGQSERFTTLLEQAIREYEQNGLYEKAARAASTGYMHHKAADLFERASLFEEAARAARLAGNDEQEKRLLEQVITQSVADGSYHYAFFIADRAGMHERAIDAIVQNPAMGMFAGNYAHDVGENEKAFQIFRNLRAWSEAARSGWDAGMKEEVITMLTDEGLWDIAAEYARCDFSLYPRGELFEEREISKREAAGNVLSAALYARDRGKKERAISILEQGNMYPQAAHFARELEFPEQEIRRLETKAIKALESEGSFYEAAVLAHGAGRHEKATTLFDKA
ncbi:MAG TPA: hypothetical protein VJI32_07640, partial [Candidatus Nanoarchaeia archaeon]|nr:hypothetical protein [Candidatus Nanoarchaeia archaeon]